MKIAVVGIGYVGLSNAILLSIKNQVVAVDVMQERVDMINNRISPLVDKEIEEYLSKKQLNLSATTNLAEAVQNAEFVIIATPTNYDEKKNYFDTSSVEQVAEQVVSINPSATIVVKSTVPVGFTKKIKLQIHSNNVLFSPEFLREGKALYDNLNPTRIIVGVDMNDDKMLDKAKTLLHLLSQSADKKQIPQLLMNATEAEAVKLFANTYLALRVSYFNELDTYAEIHGLDSKTIIEGVCFDPRIGQGYNNPSFGYGGYCLPKDTKQLLANYNDVPENIIRAIVESNRTRKDYITQRVLQLAKNTGKKHIVVGIFRLTMKTGSDNFRQSAIQGIIKRLAKKNVEILIYEPTAKTDEFYGHRIIKDLQEFKQKCDIIIANRMEKTLSDIASKVYTRDAYGRD